VRSPKELNFRKNVVADILSDAEHYSRKAEQLPKPRNHGTHRLLSKDCREIPEMKRDTVDLLRKAVAENRRAYVLINNRSEGNAPLSVQALEVLLRDEATLAQ
jgi:hypothetical protein